MIDIKSFLKFFYYKQCFTDDPYLWVCKHEFF